MSDLRHEYDNLKRIEHEIEDLGFDLGGGPLHHYAQYATLSDADQEKLRRVTSDIEAWAEAMVNALVPLVRQVNDSIRTFCAEFAETDEFKRWQKEQGEGDDSDLS